ncbi:aspartate-semialdehyde dehydrogenase [Candidatus Chlorohelix sp.]|uniref:aspartate-semialdehyde dehydrogenase n=1 Tax=Candidatus Chlorohelix sp. TaxID=3139201 RepID=UPI003047FAA9
MAGYNLAIVGATELTGQELIKILQSRRFPVNNIKFLTNPAQYVPGRRVFFSGKDFEVPEITSRAFKEVDIAFFCGDAETAQHFAPIITEFGCFVIDVSGAFRGDEKVLSIIPEINAEELQQLKKKRLVASPSPAVIQLSLPLNTLRQWTSLRRLIVHSYEPVSESGHSAVEFLTTEARTVLDGKNVIPHTYHHQIAFNLLPETENFLDTGLTRSEARIIREIKRLWRMPELNIAVTAIRVPLYQGMSQSIIVDLGKKVTPDEMREVMGDTPGVKVSDDPSVNLYPQPWQSINTDDIVVGRIRELDSNYNTMAFWSCMDNLRKGSALNAIQIAESASRLKLV